MITTHAYTLRRTLHRTTSLLLHSQQQQQQQQQQQCRHTSTQRSLENLLNNPIATTTTGGQININHPHPHTRTDDLSIFMYEKLPLLKFHNKSLNVTCTQHTERGKVLRVGAGDEGWV